MIDYIELCNRLTIIANEYAKRGKNDVSDTLYEASDTIYRLCEEERVNAAKCYDDYLDFDKRKCSAKKFTIEE